MDDVSLSPVSGRTVCLLGFYGTDDGEASVVAHDVDGLSCGRRRPFVIGDGELYGTETGR